MAAGADISHETFVNLLLRDSIHYHDDDYDDNEISSCDIVLFSISMIILALSASGALYETILGSNALLKYTKTLIPLDNV